MNFVKNSGAVIPAKAGISPLLAEPEIYWVYILTNTHHNVLYIGSTSSPTRRIAEHVRKNKSGFTAKYNVSKLVYTESHSTRESALKREHQMKKWNREWKENLIAEQNPTWQDLLETADNM